VSAQLHAPASLPPVKTHWMGSWVEPRTGLDDMDKRKFFTLPGLWPFRRRTHCQSLYRLCYPGSFEVDHYTINSIKLHSLQERLSFACRHALSRSMLSRVLSSVMVKCSLQSKNERFMWGHVWVSAPEQSRRFSLIQRGRFTLKVLGHFQIWSKSDNNNGHFTWTPTRISASISNVTGA
jgi:hypothetical protein